MHMLKLGWVTLWEAAWLCHLKQYCVGQCRQYGRFCSTDLWVHGGGIGVLTLKRSESNSCYAKAPKRFLYGEVEMQKGGGATTHSCAWQLHLTTLHIATVLGGYCTLNRAFLGLDKYKYDPFSHVWVPFVYTRKCSSIWTITNSCTPHFMLGANTHLHFLVDSFWTNHILLFAGICGQLCNIFFDERKNSGEWKVEIRHGHALLACPWQMSMTE